MVTATKNRNISFQNLYWNHWANFNQLPRKVLGCYSLKFVFDRPVHLQRWPSLLNIEISYNRHHFFIFCWKELKFRLSTNVYSNELFGIYKQCTSVFFCNICNIAKMWQICKLCLIWSKLILKFEGTILYQWMTQYLLNLCYDKCMQWFIKSTFIVSDADSCEPLV